jgi:hypothetical protein
MIVGPQARMFACAVLVSSSGCGGSQSNYLPSNTITGELTWRYDSGLQLQKGERQIGDLSDLAHEVASVPAASHDAARGAALTSSGRVWGVTALAAMLAGIGAATAMVLASHQGRDHDLLYGSLGALGGGLVLGITFGGIGSAQSSEGLALQLDAFNRYNDTIWRRASPSAPRLATKAAPTAEVVSVQANLNGVQLWLLGVPRAGATKIALRFQHYGRGPELRACDQLEVIADGSSRNFALVYKADVTSVPIRERVQAEIDLDLLSQIIRGDRVEFNLCGLRRGRTVEVVDAAKTFESRFKTLVPTESVLSEQPATSTPDPASTPKTNDPSKPD